MRNPFTRIGLRTWVVIAVAILVLGWGLFRQLSAMDPRFFLMSSAGLRGLALYLVGDYSGAARSYRVHLKDVVQQTREEIEPAWGALIEGDFVRAKAIAREQVAGPLAKEALLTLGEVALAEGEPRQALNYLAQVLEKETDQFDARLLGSLAHARLGEYPRAIDAVNRALRHDRAERRITVFLAALETTGDLSRLPSGQRPLCLVAHYYRYLRIYDPANGGAAIRYARAAIDAGDQPGDAFLTMGVIYAKQGQRESAFQGFLEGIRRNPRNAEAYRWAARSYSDRGDLVNEYRMWKAAFEAAPGDGYYADGLHDVLTRKLGDYRQAIQVYREVLRTRPEEGAVWSRLGDVYRVLGDHPLSVEAYEKAAALDPHDPSRLVSLGWALLQTGEKGKAVLLFEEAVSLDAGRADSYYALASGYYGLRRYPEAIAAHERSIALGGVKRPDQLLPLCGLYQQASAFERAERCVNAVLAMEPGNVTARRWLRDIQHNLALKRGRQ